MIYWMSQKRRRISHSAYGAEILACADGTDRGLHVMNCVKELLEGRKADNILHVDIKGLFDTISTLHNSR